MLDPFRRVVPAIRAILLFLALGAGCEAGPGRAALGVPATAYHVREATRAATRPSVAPMSLTASDGTGLALARLDVRAVLVPPLAFTELDLAFDNPNDRTIEGRFRIMVPARASLSRFAMRIGEDWQDAEFVEKRAAREAYEDFLHRRQDPALLEQGAGNEFSARVFPIPARSQKMLKVAYAQELDADGRYALPLAGLPELGSLQVSVSIDGQPILERQQEHVVPEDVILESRGKGALGLRADELAIVRIQPGGNHAPDPLASPLVLVDTSASRALEFEEQIAIVRSILTGAGSTVAEVACFDQEITPVFSGAASSFGQSEANAIRNRAALGASDLWRALGYAKARARAGVRRVVIVTDGVPTVGETKAEELRAAVRALGDAGIQRLDAVAVGGIRDDDLLQKLVSAGLARDGIVARAEGGTADVLRRLGEATQSNLAVGVEGADWFWPRRLDSVQAGDSVLVFAEVPPSMPIRVRVGTTALPVIDLPRAPRPLVERAWAKAKIESLLVSEGSQGEKKAELRRKVVDLSTRLRIASPYTSLLVLETDQDYARFGIDRHRLADLLVIDRGRVVVQSRRNESKDLADDKTASGREAGERSRDGRAPASEISPRSVVLDTRAQTSAQGLPAPIGEPPQAEDTAASPVGDALGAGGLGLTGIGEGGGGLGQGIGMDSFGTLGHGDSVASGERGHGRLSGAHGSRAPTIRAGQTQVSGRLPPEVIQRIVRQSYGRFRRCYETGLRTNPNLAGRVAVLFLIGRDGNTSRVANAGSDLPDPEVVQCVMNAFLELAFPRPEAGIVRVIYPIMFAPEPSRVPAPARAVPAAPADPAGTTAVRDSTASPVAGASNVSPATPADPWVPARKPTTLVDPYNGRFQTVMSLLHTSEVDQALTEAWAWHRSDPGNVLALVGLGEALTAKGQIPRAARAYGSIIDLYAARADLRRFAGAKLEALASTEALAMAVDTFRKAAEDRPDHPSSHRLLAFALLKSGEPEKAFDALATGARRRYPQGRFEGVDRILREDLGLIAAAWVRREPNRAAEIEKRLLEAGGTPENRPSLRFVLNWETDANDVDFHIEDAEGRHAYFAQKHLESGGDLYADVTTGYGPECFTIRRSGGERSGPYTLRAHYYARGPMGFGMGKLEIVDHDGAGGLTFEERPYVVMADRAYVDLGTVKR